MNATTKQIKKNFSLVGWGMTAQIVIGTGLCYLVSFILSKTLGDSISNPSLRLLVGCVPLWITVLLSYLIFKKVPTLEVKKEKLSFGFLAKSYFAALFLGYCGSFIGLLINRITGIQTNPITDIISGAPLWLQLLLTVIGAPIIEELLFRKILIDRMRRYGEVTAILISAAMFGLYHGNFTQMFYAFGAGIMLGYVYVKGNYVKYNIGIHMVINVVGILLTALITGFDYETFLAELQEITTSGKIELLEEFITAHQNEILRLAAIELICFVIIGFFITGIVIFFNNVKHIEFNKTIQPIAKKEKFNTIFVNAGMIVVTVTFIAYCVLQMS